MSSFNVSTRKVSVLRYYKGLQNITNNLQVPFVSWLIKYETRVAIRGGIEVI